MYMILGMIGLFAILMVNYYGWKLIIDIVMMFFFPKPKDQDKPKRKYDGYL